MLKVTINGHLIDNIVIIDNDLYFTDYVNGDTVYRLKPVSKYRYDSDSYNDSMTLIFQTLKFYSTYEIHLFKNAVLDNVKDLNFNFDYNGCSVNVTAVNETDIKITDD